MFIFFISYFFNFVASPVSISRFFVSSDNYLEIDDVAFVGKAMKLLVIADVPTRRGNNFFGIQRNPGNG